MNCALASPSNDILKLSTFCGWWFDLPGLSILRLGFSLLSLLFLGASKISMLFLVLVPCYGDRSTVATNFLRCLMYSVVPPLIHNLFAEFSQLITVWKVNHFICSSLTTNHHKIIYVAKKHLNGGYKLDSSMQFMKTSTQHSTFITNRQGRLEKYWVTSK